MLEPRSEFSVENKNYEQVKWRHLPASSAVSLQRRGPPRSVLGYVGSTELCSSTRFLPRPSIPPLPGCTRHQKRPAFGPEVLPRARSVRYLATERGQIDRHSFLTEIINYVFVFFLSVYFISKFYLFDIYISM